MSRPQLIETLEPRRMLTMTFTGTNDFTDTFRVAIASDSVRVSINGGPEQVTTDNSIVLDGLFDAQGNIFEFSEVPGGTRTVPLSILVKGTGGDNEVSFGSQAAGMTLEKLNTVLTADFPDAGAQVDIYDRNEPTLENSFFFHTLSGPSRQAVTKGSFVAQFPQRSFWVINVRVHGSAANDVFAVAGQGSNTSMLVDGGGGDDTMHTVNFGSNNLDNDLDQIFAPDFFFTFDGGPGNDYLDLDDSADQTGDGDDHYGLIGGTFSKGFSAFNSIKQQNVEQLYLAMDGDPNELVMYGCDGIVVTVVGGAGNDTLTNDSAAPSPNTLFDFADGGGFFGGSGIDSIELFDTDGQSNASYTFDTGSFSIGAAEFEYDSTLESFLLEQNDFGSTNILNGKPAGMALTINAYDGTDSFKVGGGDLDSNGLRNTTLVGGGGIDPIEFDDRQDADAAGESETYNFGVFTLTKGSLAIQYSAFDQQTLRAADGGLAPFQPSTVNINAFSGQIDSTTIIGGANRPLVVNLGNGTIPIVDTVNLNFGAAGGSFNINDQSAAAGVTYNLSANQLSTPVLVNFTNASNVNLNAGPQNDTIAITGSAAGTAVAVACAGGNDIITLGQGNIDADLAGVVTVNGGGGSNRLTVDNSNDPDPATLTINATTVVAAVTHPYSGITSRIVNTGAGGTNLAVNSVIVPTTINGGSGDDVISIGGGSLTNNLTANATVNGGGGNDELIILGQDDTTTASTFNRYAFPSLTQFRFGDTTTGKIITYSGLEQATLQSSGGHDDIDVSAATIPLKIFSNGGNDAVNVAGPSAPVTVNTGPESTLPFGFRQGDSFTVGGILGNGTVVIDQNDTVISMGVNTGSTLRLANGAILNKTWPSVFFIDFGTNLTGTFDLGSGALLWRDGGGSGILPDFRGLLTRGRNGGAWNGTGTGAGGAIHSSFAASTPLADAVGYGLGSEIALTGIGGFGIAAGDTLLRYSLDGDANLDQTVDITDLGILATNWQGTNKVWTQADSNYDNATDITDLGALATNWQKSHPPLAAAPGGLSSISPPARKPTARLVAEITEL